MKLIFFDIDGTLVERGKIPDSAVRAIRKAQENGHLCLVNTGRSACLVTGWLPELVPFDGYLCGCGTQILFHGKEILHKTFSREEALDILEGLKKYRIDAILEGSGNNYHEDPANMYTETFRRYIAKASPERYMPKELVEKGWGRDASPCGNRHRHGKFHERSDGHGGLCHGPRERGRHCQGAGMAGGLRERRLTNKGRREAGRECTGVVLRIAWSELLRPDQTAAKDQCAAKKRIDAVLRGDVRTAAGVLKKKFK